MHHGKLLNLLTSACMHHGLLAKGRNPSPPHLHGSVCSHQHVTVAPLPQPPLLQLQEAAGAASAAQPGAARTSGSAVVQLVYGAQQGGRLLREGHESRGRVPVEAANGAAARKAGGQTHTARAVLRIFSVAVPMQYAWALCVFRNAPSPRPGTHREGPDRMPAQLRHQATHALQAHQRVQRHHVARAKYLPLRRPAVGPTGGALGSGPAIAAAGLPIGAGGQAFQLRVHSILQRPAGSAAAVATLSAAHRGPVSLQSRARLNGLRPVHNGYTEAHVAHGLGPM